MKNRYLWLLGAFLISATAHAQEAASIVVSEPLWSTDHATIQAGGSLPVPRTLRLQCPGYVQSRTPNYTIQYQPQAEFGGTIEFLTSDPGIIPMVRNPIGIFLCGKAGQPLRLSASPGVYQIWYASPEILPTPQPITFSVQHVL